MDHEVLTGTLMITRALASAATIIFVILYALVPWYKTLYGRVMMFSSITLAFNMTTRFLFSAFDMETTPAGIYFKVWVNLITFLGACGLIVVFVISYKDQLNRLRERDQNDSEHKAL